MGEFRFADLVLKMASQPSRQRSRWGLDFATKSGGGRSGGSGDLPAPPGLTTSLVSLHAEEARQTDPSLRAKRSWDMALGPIKQAPINLFIMYMSGNAISIVPIMMVIMMVIRPLKTLFSVGSTFKALDAASADGPSSNSAANLGQKMIYVVGNLVNLGLALNKCHSMGLLPTHASDWLAFADPVDRVEWTYT